MSVRISSRVDGGTTVVTVDDVGAPAERMRLRRDLMLHAERGSGPLVVDLRPVPCPGTASDAMAGCRYVLADLAARAARTGRRVDVVGLPTQGPARA